MNNCKHIPLNTYWFICTVNWIQRERKGWGEREREIDRLPPDHVPTSQPRSKPATFWCRWTSSNRLNHPVRAHPFSFSLKKTHSFWSPGCLKSGNLFMSVMLSKVGVIRREKGGGSKGTKAKLLWLDLTLTQLTFPYSSQGLMKTPRGTQLPPSGLLELKHN